MLEAIERRFRLRLAQKPSGTRSCASIPSPALAWQSPAGARPDHEGRRLPHRAATASGPPGSPLPLAGAPATPQAHPGRSRRRRASDPGRRGVWTATAARGASTRSQSRSRWRDQCPINPHRMGICGHARDAPGSPLDGAARDGQQLRVQSVLVGSPLPHLPRPAQSRSRQHAARLIGGSRKATCGLTACCSSHSGAQTDATKHSPRRLADRHSIFSMRE